MTKIDRHGKRRSQLSARAERYFLERIAHPDKPKYQCAMAVGVPRDQARSRASEWESNPFFEDRLRLLVQKEQERPALESAAQWVRRVKRRGAKAEAAEDYGAALRSDALLAAHLPIEGLVRGGEVAQQNNTFNFNGPNPFSGWSLEELAAWRAEHRARIAEGKVVDADAT